MRFVEQVKRHPSKASAGYYYKTHVDYFDKMFRSLRAISSVLRSNGKAVLVVQDSYYKEVHNQLPNVFIEMAIHYGMVLYQRMDFSGRPSMGSVNSSSRKYRVCPAPIESVLCFQKS